MKNWKEEADELRINLALNFDVFKVESIDIIAESLNLAYLAGRDGALEESARFLETKQFGSKDGVPCLFDDPSPDVLRKRYAEALRNLKERL